ncbi:cell cycle checkpoint [Mrakia frigida]|uniref:cell cycle checkpoint n=1 Tax=Mrakia frigida TaxID=29902 RepID=UPI003FCBF3AC
MRFRASVSEVSTFVQIVKSVSRLSQKCIMRFGEEKMHLICHDATEGGVQVWSQVKVTTLFTAYRIESNQNNEIHLSTSISDLLSVLNSASAMQGKGEVVVKLAKRPVGEQGHLKPVLIWEIGGDTKRGRPPRLIHEHHIKVLKPNEIELLREPLCPEPDIHILLPPLATVRTVTEHLAKLSPHLTISANMGGKLTFKAGQNEAKGVEVETEWGGLKVPSVVNSSGDGSQQQQPERSEDPSHFFSTQVSVKSLLRFLHAHSIMGSTVACICEGHSLIMYLYIGEHEEHGGVLTFFIPAVDGDQDD